MPLFRGSKNATVSTGDVVATQADIGNAVTLAEQAQAASEAAQAAAEAALDNFDDRYLGAKSSDPTVDNDGDPLIDGALYYNTNDKMTRVYDFSSDSWSDLKPTDTEQSNINALAPVASQVETVGNNISDVTTVSDDLSGADTVGTVAGSIANVNATGTDIANVNTVAGELGAGQDVTVVAADLSGTDTVGTVAGSIGDVSTVATDLSGADTVGTVATNIADVNTTASDITNVNTVATSIDNVNTTATNIADVNTVAGIDTDVTTVAGISSDVTTVAADEADIGTVSTNIASVDVIASDLAGAGFDYDLGSITQATEGVVGAPDGYIITLYDIRPDISAVAAIDSDVQIAAANVADITNFADVYIGPAASDPTLRTDGSVLQPGDLYFNTTDSDLKVYDGSSWKDASLDTTETRNLFSGGTGVTYNAGTGEFAIGQSVGTTDNVQFEEVDATTVNADFIDCGTIA